MDFKKMFAGDPKAKEKLEICKTCSFYNASIQVCKKCGCYMPLKVKIPGNKCPIGKHIV